MCKAWLSLGHLQATDEENGTPVCVKCSAPNPADSAIPCHYLDCTRHNRARCRVTQLCKAEASMVCPGAHQEPAATRQRPPGEGWKSVSHRARQKPGGNS
jgi:hypothetical protein